MYDFPHRRYNPLTGEWILVSPHRTERPWRGQVEKVTQEVRPAYDPDCYLCPRNERAGGAARNPQYENTFVFTNDFAALLPAVAGADSLQYSLLRSEDVQGTCRVMCFSPRHDLTLPELSIPDLCRIIDVWAEQVIELGKQYQWVQIFENKGAMMGCSNPHPHGQIWALNVMPNEPDKENSGQKAYYTQSKTSLLVDYAALETQRGERIVVENEHWLGVVPYWATWPFETLLLPKRHVLRLPELNEGERATLAEILKRLLTRYDNLFETSFPYSMGWHGAPYLPTNASYEHWQLHAHFYPPLLRSATVKKFMVGYEMLAEAQRDLTPEGAAERLRQVSEIHFKDRFNHF